MPCQANKCQFAYQNRALIPSTGGFHCIFHAPIDFKKGWGKNKKEQFNKDIFDFIDRCLNNNKLINLSNVIFPGAIDFSGRTFSNISFKDAQFVDSVYFNGTQFQGRANFQGASFFDTAVFSGSVFIEGVDFRSAHLNMGGDFEETEFGEFTDFGEVTLTGEVSFFNAKFGEYASFRDVNFNSTVCFQDAEFKGEVDFQNACFKERTEFIKTQFDGPVNFSEIIKGDRVLGFPELKFNGSLFKDAVVFNNRKFLVGTNFENCTFNKAPEFHNCELHQDTVFPPERFFKDTESKGAASAYRTLKLAMGNVQAHREQGMFYALEQKSLRNDPEVSKMAKIFSWLYEKSANYGQSLELPLLHLFRTIIGFFGVFFVIACICPSRTMSAWELVVKTLGFSLKQAFQPFYVLRQPSLEWITDVTGIRLVKALATLESLLILGLFALFLLCVRWNFKRG